MYFNEFGFVLIPLIVFGFIIYVIVRIIMHLVTPPEHRRSITLDQVKRGGVAMAIAILLPVFINLTVSSIVSDAKDVFGFVLALVLSLGGLAAGFFARRNPVVGGSVTVGSLFGLLYAIGIRFPNFDPWVKTVIVGIGLLATTALSYLVGLKRDPIDQSRTALHGIKAFAAGVIIYSFAMLFVVNLNGTLNPPPVYPSYAESYPVVPPRYYDYQNRSVKSAPGAVVSQAPQTFSESEQGAFQEYERELTVFNQKQTKASQQYEKQRKEHERNSFVIVIIVSFVYLITGVLVRQVAVVSIGMIAAGLISIIYTLILSFDELGRAAMAIVTGIGVILLIGLAYWKLGHTGEQSDS